MKLLLLLLLAATSALGCASGCDKPLAILKESEGHVDRDFSKSLNVWERAELGAHFRVGDGVKTGSKSGALLTLDDGSEAGLKSNTLVRFLETPPKSSQQGLDVVTGEATLSVGSTDLGLLTNVGLALLRAGSKITLRRADQAVRFEVNVGSARFETKTGPLDVKAGQGVEIGIGQAVLERFDLNKEAAPAATEAAAKAEVAQADAPETGEIGLNVDGAGARLKEPGAKDWTALKPGAHALSAGSTLSLPRGTSATVTRGNRQVVLRGQGQFVVASTGSAFIQTESGGISVAATSGAVSITVPGGTITTLLGGLSDLQVKRDATAVSVRVGEVEIKTEKGVETLRGGETAKLSSAGAVDVGGRGPGYADILLAAGDSIAVHDPSPPTSVGIRFGDRCKQGGVVQLMRSSTEVATSSRSETGIANILIPVGLHTYRLRCLGPNGLEEKPVATGRVSVRRDSGTSQLPSSAPRTQVETDGRKYTVLYQNLLPQIAVRWKDAPAASSYKLTIKSNGKTENLSARTPNYFFPSASLPEGTHQMVFEAGIRRSRPTTVTISFDNAAPTARIASPQDRSFAPGASVTVSGVALPGWTVAVGGQEIPMDAQNRFSGTVTTPSELKAFAIRFAHPSRGVRFYLRRAAQ
ncbi:MAG: hypothetical protein SFV15_08770 [Polyangiaceae bacterium]|nr:hypothetical protein [Polyangiaceae bacterium]